MLVSWNPTNSQRGGRYNATTHRAHCHFIHQIGALLLFQCEWARRESLVFNVRSRFSAISVKLACRCINTNVHQSAMFQTVKICLWHLCNSAVESTYSTSPWEPFVCALDRIMGICDLLQVLAVRNGPILAFLYLYIDYSIIDYFIFRFHRLWQYDIDIRIFIYYFCSYLTYLCIIFTSWASLAPTAAGAGTRLGPDGIYMDLTTWCNHSMSSNVHVPTCVNTGSICEVIQPQILKKPLFSKIPSHEYLPIPSMGLVYLPTFGCRCMVNMYHAWMVWVRESLFMCRPKSQNLKIAGHSLCHCTERERERDGFTSAMLRGDEDLGSCGVGTCSKFCSYYLHKSWHKPQGEVSCSKTTISSPSISNFNRFGVRFLCDPVRGPCWLAFPCFRGRQVQSNVNEQDRGLEHSNCKTHVGTNLIYSSYLFLNTRKIKAIDSMHSRFSLSFFTPKR